MAFSIFCPFFSKCLCTSLSLLLPLKGLEFSFRTLFMPHVRESKKLSDFGFNSVYSGFHVLDSSLCQWKCMPQWDSVFLALYSRFQSPGFRIAQATIPGFRNPNSLNGATVLKQERLLNMFIVFEICRVPGPSRFRAKRLGVW